MAASATNTSREIGAVTGVAILGALVNTRLQSDLKVRLQHLGIPPNFQSLIIKYLETGAVPSSGQRAGPANAQGIVNQVIHAAYGAFATGLHDALYLSAALVIIAAIIAAITLRKRPEKADSATL